MGKITEFCLESEEFLKSPEFGGKLRKSEAPRTLMSLALLIGGQGLEDLFKHWYTTSLIYAYIKLVGKWWSHLVSLGGGLQTQVVCR